MREPGPNAQSEDGRADGSDRDLESEVEPIDLQGSVIGWGSIGAFGALAYGIVVSPTIFGIAATSVAALLFALTFLGVGVLHTSVGKYGLAWSHGGAAAGLLFVFLGTTGPQIAIGLLLLVLAGAYIVLVSLRDKREAEASNK